METLRVRVNSICVVRYDGQEYKAGDELSLPSDKALYYAQVGTVTLLDYIKQSPEDYVKKSSSFFSSEGEGENQEEEENLDGN
jgi:hypothetical protein